MDARSLSRSRAGFTLVELLVVIAIITGLAAIAWTSMGYMNRLAYAKKAEAQLGALQTGLQEYKNDQGAFPQSTSTEYANVDESGGALYQALSGNGNSLLGGGEQSLDELDGREDLTGPAYIPELLPGNDGDQNWVLDIDGQLTVVDTWGRGWRYVSGDPTNQHNVDYDLWSLGQDGFDSSRPDSGEEGDDISNWR